MMESDALYVMLAALIEQHDGELQVYEESLKKVNLQEKAIVVRHNAETSAMVITLEWENDINEEFENQTAE